MSSVVGYKIKVTKNGEEIDGLVLERQHELGHFDKTTLSGHAIVRLEKNDIIMVELVPLNDKMEYTIEAGDARLNFKLERRF